MSEARKNSGRRRGHRHDHALRRLHGARRRLDQGAGRLLPRAARRERRRQIDAGQMHDGLLPPDLGPDPGRRARGDDRQPQGCLGARARHGLPAFHAGRLADRRGEPGDLARRACRASSTGARSARRSARSWRRMPFKLPLDVPVRELAAGEKQKLEIIKQLYLGRHFLVLDEPTSVLTPGEATEVLGLVRGMTRARRPDRADDQPQVPRGHGLRRRHHRAAQGQADRDRQGVRARPQGDGRDDDRRPADRRAGFAGAGAGRRAGRSCRSRR